jgi:hypothetical protein
VRSSGRMFQAEMSQDVVPGAFDASFPADHSVEAAEVPSPPTQDVLPKALPVALSLIKLASTFTQATVLKAQVPRRKAEASPPHGSGSRENQNLGLCAL